MVATIWHTEEHPSLSGDPFLLAGRPRKYRRPDDCGFFDQDLACRGCGNRPPRDGSCPYMIEVK